MEKYEPDVKQAKWYENHREDNFNLYQRVYGHETSRSGGEK
jgi:hypothetical protein